MFRIAFKKDDEENNFLYFLLGEIKRITMENGENVEYRTLGSPVRTDNQLWYCYNI